MPNEGLPTATIDGTVPENPDISTPPSGSSSEEISRLKEKAGLYDTFNDLVADAQASGDFSAVNDAFKGSGIAMSKIKKAVKEVAEESGGKLKDVFDENTAAIFEKVLGSSFDKKMGPILERLESMEQGITFDKRTVTVNNQIEATRKKYPDFDKYIPQMSEVVKTIPGIDPESAYLLAIAKEPRDTSKDPIDFDNAKKKIQASKVLRGDDRSTKIATNINDQVYDTFEDCVKNVKRSLGG